MFSVQDMKKCQEHLSCFDDCFRIFVLNTSKNHDFLWFFRCLVGHEFSPGNSFQVSETGGAGGGSSYGIFEVTSA